MTRLETGIYYSTPKKIFKSFKRKTKNVWGRYKMYIYSIYVYIYSIYMGYYRYVSHGCEDDNVVLNIVITF